MPVWVFPGGGIEKGEAPEEAIIREIKEETNLDVSIKRLVATYTSGRFLKPVHLYECTMTTYSLSLSKETQGVAFFPLSALPKEIPPPFEEFLSDCLKNLPPIVRPVTSITPWRVAKLFLLHPILSLRFFLSRLGLHLNTP